MPPVKMPPRARERYPGEHLWRLRGRPLQTLIDIARECGPVAYFKVGMQVLYTVNEPELIRDVLVTYDKSFKKGRALERARRMLGDGLVTSEGDLHRRQRRLMQPAFHKQRIAAYAEVMVRRAIETSQHWRNGGEIEAHEVMNELALEIVAETLFGSYVENDAAAVREALFETMRSLSLFTPPLADLLDYLPLPSVLRFKRARARLDAVVYRLIDEHRRGLGRPDDLLNLLLAARDEEAADGAANTGMTDQQVRDEAMTIFLAGHETTANALSWTWYLLSEHPDVEARWHDEIDAVLQGSPPTLDHLPRLVYTRQVFAEAMRLYPTAWTLGRRCLRTVQLGPYTVKPRDIVVMSQYVVHRDPRFWPDPERFDPDRFAPEAERERPRFAFFPFGGGSRVCIGESFAWMEGVLVLAAIGQQWTLRRVPDQAVDVQVHITLRPRHGLRMTTHRRVPAAGVGVP